MITSTDRELQPSDESDHVKHIGDSGTLAAQLRRKILSGEYRHSERLPAERSLAHTFGCSRGTVRSAMQKLESLNLIERRVGAGTFVHYQAHADEPEIANITTPLELIDARLGLEPRIARLAAANATATGLDKLAGDLEELESIRNNSTPDTFIEADRAFYLTLAECTGNALMIWLCKHLNDVRQHQQWCVLKDQLLTTGNVKRYIRQHRTIYNAVLYSDSQLAEQLAIEHLRLVREDLQSISVTETP